MIIPGASNSMNALIRIGLWFGSLLLAVTLFILLVSGPAIIQGGPDLFLLRYTVTFALPGWCLYLPFVIVLKDAEKRRGWTLICSWVLIGPAALVLWGLILQLRGGDPHTIWHGDPLSFTIGGVMIFALMMGFLTSYFYVVALKVLHPRLHGSAPNPNR